MNYQEVYNGMKKEAGINLKGAGSFLNRVLNRLTLPKVPNYKDRMSRLFYRNLFDKGTIKADRSAFNNLPEDLQAHAFPIVQGLTQKQRNMAKLIRPQFERHKGPGYYVGDVFSRDVRNALGEDYLDRWLKAILNYRRK